MERVLDRSRRLRAVLPGQPGPRRIPDTGSNRCLALVFLCVGFVYFFLEAEFIGVVQILVYVGAITILFAFSIMLTRRYIMKKEGEE